MHGQAEEYFRRLSRLHSERSSQSVWGLTLGVEWRFGKLFIDFIEQPADAVSFKPKAQVLHKITRRFCAFGQGLVWRHVGPQMQNDEQCGRNSNGT